MASRMTLGLSQIYMRVQGESSLINSKPESIRAKAIAPWWHTCALIAFFLVLTLAGIVFQQRAGSAVGIVAQHPNMAPAYLSLILAQWALLYYVWKVGLRRTGTKLSELIGGRWAGTTHVLRDIALAVGLCLTWLLIQVGWDRLFGSGQAATISPFLPQGSIEIFLWILLSISAGVCEEVVFRGYFQKQFQAWTGSAGLALLLQAVLFGISHGYQGTAATLKIIIFGCLFGLCAYWRKSLRPGIVAHALSDILAVLYLLLRR
jgi:membrane protease YdiL (CAAX protease family)